MLCKLLAIHLFHRMYDCAAECTITIILSFVEEVFFHKVVIVLFAHHQGFSFHNDNKMQDLHTQSVTSDFLSVRYYKHALLFALDTQLSHVAILCSFYYFPSTAYPIYNYYHYYYFIFRYEFPTAL